MKNIIISVVVPVYNVEKYVRKCIQSILDQTFKNFELILVDDGSTDNSGKICDEFLKKDKRISVIHKKNGGLSDARNVGIDNSTGEYITFIDSDDFIEKNYLQIHYDLIKKYDSNLVISSYTNFNEGTEPNEVLLNINSDIISKEDCYKKMFLQDTIDVSATAKLYKTNIFKDNKIYYPKGKPYEDIQIIDKIVENSKNIVMTDYKGYYYLQRSGSIMYGSMSNDRMILINKMDELLDFVSKKYPNIIKYAVRRYVYSNFHVLGRSVMDDKFINKSKEMRKNILKYKKEILKEKIYSKKEKLATIILLFGIKFYKFFWSLYCKKNNKRMG